MIRSYVECCTLDYMLLWILGGIYYCNWVLNVTLYTWLHYNYLDRLLLLDRSSEENSNNNFNAYRFIATKEHETVMKYVNY